MGVALPVRSPEMPLTLFPMEMGRPAMVTDLVEFANLYFNAEASCEYGLDSRSSHNHRLQQLCTTDLNGELERRGEILNSARRGDYSLVQREVTSILAHRNRLLLSPVGSLPPGLTSDQIRGDIAYMEWLAQARVPSRVSHYH